MRRPIRVLIVDDSALVRSLLTDILEAAPGIEVAGVAADAHVAREKIKQLNPDVLTLDVEMPRMDGITFLRNLMRLRPMPVVMVSSLTERGADVTLDALALGAVDYLSKPRIDLAATLKDYADELIEKIHVAARASVRALDPHRLERPVSPGLRTAPMPCCPGRRATGRCEPPTVSLRSAPRPAARRRSRKYCCDCRRTAPASSSLSTSPRHSARRSRDA